MATAKASKLAPAAEGGAAPAKSKKLLILIVAGVLLLAICGGGAWFFLGGGGSHAPAAARHAPAKPPVFLVLETFTVNLQQDDAQQFLQANLTFQVADNAQSELIKLHMPQVRNRMLLLLSSKKASEILTVDGKKKLAEEIIDQMKKPFTPNGPEQEVSDVFFTSFVVQ